MPGPSPPAPSSQHQKRMTGAKRGRKEGEDAQRWMETRHGLRAGPVCLLPGYAASNLTPALPQNQSSKDPDAALAGKAGPPSEFLGALAHQRLLAPHREMNPLTRS